MSEQQQMRRKLEMTRQVALHIEKMKKPYILAKRYDWEGFRKFFSKHKDLLDKQIDLHYSTPFHYAAHCGRPEMYKEMLQWLGKQDIKRLLRLQDDMGNTPLHEVAFTGEVEMTKSIMKHEEVPGSDQFLPLLEMRNHLGETPVYRAAALGKTDLLSFFLEDLQVDPNIHFYRQGDRMSILHTAVIDQFFGTALWILKRYDYLAYEKEDNDLTTLQLLAKMPSTFKSQTQMGPFKSFIYLLLPDFQDYKYYHQSKQRTTKKEDLESGQNNRKKPSPTQMQVEDSTREGQNLNSNERGRNESPTTQRKLSAFSIAIFSWMWYTMWKILAKEWKEIDKLWRKKEMHNLAKQLVYLLAHKDYSWRNTAIARDRTVSMGRSQQEGKSKDIKEEQDEEKKQKGIGKTTYTPLLMAACNGITEIVELIIHFHPHSIEHVSDDEQNILYMAVKHRQKKIYRILKKLKIVRSLAGKIDQESNTVLHYTAEFQGGSQPGYAMQLQEELHWFDRIEKRLPYHYTVHKNQHNKTAKQLFVEKHRELLKDAREWIKETAQSCSAVAVLVATVVFAAAYTVPGGTDDRGFPRFLGQPIFLVFTIMDVVALISSLGSVIMFLSILTSPCEMWDFRKSLPRKLMTGFALLFFSMATTMLSFSATILINIKLQGNKWTSSVTYGAAFLPVCIFALVQFPLYVALKGCVRTILRNLKKIIPRFLLKLLKKSRRKKLWDI